MRPQLRSLVILAGAAALAEVIDPGSVQRVIGRVFGDGLADERATARDGLAAYWQNAYADLMEQYRDRCDELDALRAERPELVRATREAIKRELDMRNVARRCEANGFDLLCHDVYGAVDQATVTL